MSLTPINKKIIICGGNGAGKSTLGENLATVLGYKFMDIENYYFPLNNNDYSVSRTPKVVNSLLLKDIKKYSNCIVASVKGNFGDEIISMFTHVIFVYVSKDIRMNRVKYRSLIKFGNRILPGGDLYKKRPIPKLRLGLFLKFYKNLN